MNPKTMKISAASLGTLTLFATALSLGGGHPKVADAADAPRRDGAALAAPSSASRPTTGSSDANTAGQLDDTLVIAARHAQHQGARTALATMSTGSDGSESSGNAPASPDDIQSITVTVPHQVTVVMPSYEGGREPSVTWPTYEPGTDPSVEQDGRKIVVDPGESGTWTNPDVDPGESGTLTPPQVIVE